jgi:hypothetical protein
MIEIDPDTGAEIVLESLKYEKVDGAKADKDDITVKPSRLHHDFEGWSLDGTNVLTKDQWDALIFDSSHTLYTLYAVFKTTSYKAEFIDVVSGYKEEVTKVHGLPFTDPEIIPSRAEDSEDLLTRIAFVGWTDKDDLSSYVVTSGQLSNLQINPSDYIAEKNYKFYALFVKENVLEVATDNKYFKFDLNEGEQTYIISVNPNYKLRGKITLPTQYNGQPITTIGNFQNAIGASHIFFMPNS